MILFGNWVLASVIQSRWGHIGLGWALNPILVFRGERDLEITLVGERVMRFFSHLDFNEL